MGGLFEEANQDRIDAVWVFVVLAPGIPTSYSELSLLEDPPHPRRMLPAASPLAQIEARADFETFANIPA